MDAENASISSCPKGHISPLPDGSRFCIQCGSRLIAVQTTPEASSGAQAVNQFQYQSPADEPAVQPQGCETCGGDGSRLDSSKRVCPACRWLRPLAQSYAVEPSAFQWSQDGAAMARLRSIGPLNAAARAISDKAGRRWIESTFNGIRLSEKQLPEVYVQAIRAAQLVGMPYLPEVYVSGDRMWDAMTFGSDNSAFVILGTALLTNFKGDDLLFLLAREMGHCRAGHALWKTVIRFLIGERGPKKGLMAGGLVHLLNPAHLIEGALELPLLAWARQAEITADRAGLLAIGDESTARRVLLSWSLKSAMLFRQINVEAWLEQQEDADDQVTRLSEIASSSTPYITRRLKLMAQFAASPELAHWRALIDRTSQLARTQVPADSCSPAPVSNPQPQSGGPTGAQLRLVCSSCQATMRIPRAALADKKALNVRCPNAQCGKVITLKKQAAPAPALRTVAAAATHNNQTNTLTTE